MGSSPSRERSLKHLVTLRLVGARFTDSGLEQLGELGGLTDLDLSGTDITDAQLKELPHLTNLKRLCVQDREPRQVASCFADMVEAELRLMECNNRSFRDKGGYYLTLHPGGGRSEEHPALASGERPLDQGKK
jgi:hypothetical protein